MANLQRRASTVQVIDTLAEITRHQNRELIEHSLVKTLAETVTCNELRLYRIVRIPPEIELLLIDQAINLPRQAGEQPPGFDCSVSPDVSDSIVEAVESGEIISHVGEVSCVVYPVEDKNGGIYAVLVQFVDRIRFEEQRLTHGLLRIYTNYLTLIDESQRDKLTSLLNRETLDETIIRLMTEKHVNRVSVPGRRQEDHSSHWLGLLDIDHFKQINDTRGHLFGDEVLILLANLMSNTLREEDLLFRYGGEEFVVIIDVPSMETARMVFERLRKMIENHPFPQIGQVTASIGVVEIATQNGPSSVIGNADRALYFAKHAGRNRVEIHEELIKQHKLSDLSEARTSSIDLF